MRIKSWVAKQPLTDKEMKKIAETNEAVLEQVRDIIVTEIIEETTYDDNGLTKTTKYSGKQHNISKNINESAKILKVEQAQKVASLLELLDQEQNKENI